MSKAYKDQLSSFISGVMRHIPDATKKQYDGSSKPDITHFIKQYFAHVPVAELQKMDTKTACSKALMDWEFVQKRTPGQAAIAITVLPSDDEKKAPRAVLQTVQKDMPFLVDSITSELTRQGYTIHSCLHPILRVTRNAKGELTTIAAPQSKQADSRAEGDGKAESLIHFTISMPGSADDTKKLENGVRRIFKAVELSVLDWQPLKQKGLDTLKELESQADILNPYEHEEAVNFLKWLLNNHFVFLGAIDFNFAGESDKAPALAPVKKSALGVLKLEDVPYAPKALDSLPPETKEFLEAPEMVAVTKANHRSIVHRPVHMDMITIKRFNKAGEVCGERRFIGLFTSNVYYEPTRTIPVIRRKIRHVIERSGFSPSGHDGKALATILEFFPRDELFQIDEDTLFEFAMGILSLESQPRVRAFSRYDRFNRFVSCLIYVPRERFSTELRYRMQSIIEEAFNGTVSAYYTQVTDSPLARVHVIVRTRSKKKVKSNEEKLNKELSEVVNAWSDSLHDALIGQWGEERGERSFRIFAKAFPNTYINRYSINDALMDIAKMEAAMDGSCITLDLLDMPESDEYFRLKIYNPNDQIALSDILPMMENMGLKVIEESPCIITPLEWPKGVWVRDFRIAMRNGAKPDIAKLKQLFEEALLTVWANIIEDDPFNQLVASARIHWRDVIILRAYSKYLKQIRFTYSEEAVEEVITRHPVIASLLVRLFYTRFDPSLGANDAGHQKGVLVELHHELSKVSAVTDDRILSRYSELIQATLRTNFFQKDAEGEYKPYMSLKINSGAVPDMPLPKPFAEIFVYSMRVEGVHLRGGPVARGGLRWSDRSEDYRTEVLGLMKAQMVKNAVIVPEGSKGGFYVKNPPKEGGRDAVLEEGIACYKIYLRGLLDITDNRGKNRKVIPPKDVVRQDGDDPYLVVAADKGTASFSDIANSVSEEYGFWLGDAFASGGSAGYDHKEMGITAKGAWVSVQRHFFDMGKDIQKEPFTVVGIGDMSGDVFGNGMLLSKQIKLIAAFNHRHIFFDPSPDPATSFKERERLFALPRSNWTDYDPKALSKGGAVFERDAKSINVTQPMRKWFGIHKDSITPDDLIRSILTADYELLWNGGIGTYVKASSESDSEVGDRANDSLRINGKEMHCKVVGEGGNLGFTQRGRIEYALNGGRINTDAIDNSAGVDCSDHEVNIKIALGAAVTKGTLTRAKRDTLLEGMTAEVEALVLRDNYQQTQAITIAQNEGSAQLESHARLMRMLEREGLLNRAMEYLPDEETIISRGNAKTGLVRPELALLLSYSKMALYRALLPSNVPDDKYFSGDLLRYFPEAMQKDYAEVIEKHPLRREIIATVITNSIINRIGSTFFFQVKSDTGVHDCDIARAYVASRDSFGLRQLWSDIENLQGKVSVQTQIDMFQIINHLIYRTTLWLLRNNSQPLNVSKIVATMQEPSTIIAANIERIMRDDTLDLYKTTRDHLKQQNVPAKLAERIAALPALASACDIVTVANSSKLPVQVVGEVYFELSAQLKIGWLRQCAESLNDGGHWTRLASTAVINDLFDQQRRLTASVVQDGCTEDQCDVAVSSWMEKHTKIVSRYMNFIEDLQISETPDFSMLVVALRKIEGISVM